MVPSVSVLCKYFLLFIFCLLVFFFFNFLSHLRIFHSFGDVTITSEGLQILTYTRNLLPSSSGGSLACHTYSDTGHPFIMVISEDRAFKSGAVTT